MGAIIGIGSRASRGGGGTPPPNLQDKDVVVTKNGEIVITADSGYNGLNKVGVSTNVEAPDPVLQNKSINITENGESSITPDSGYSGMSKVNVNVNVPQGGGGVDSSLPVLFFDYDGTLLHSYTIAEAQALTALPEQPAHEGLIGLGWTHSLQEVRAVKQILYVQSYYVSDDGKTRYQLRANSNIGNIAPSLTFKTEGIVKMSLFDSSDEFDSEDFGTNRELDFTLVGIWKLDGYFTVEQITAGVKYSVLASSFSPSSLPCILEIVVGNDAMIGGCYGHSALKYAILQRGMTAGIGCTNCYSLKFAPIFNTVTSIPYQAYQNCYSLPQLYIPGSVKSVGANAFANMFACREFIFESPTPPTFAATVFAGIIEPTRIYVPDSGVAAYKATTNMPTYAKYIHPISSRQ